MKFKLSGNMMRFSNFREEVEVTAATVEQGIVKLTEECPLLKPVLLDAAMQVRMVHRLFLNGELLDREDLNKTVGGADEVTILTAIAGG